MKAVSSGYQFLMILSIDGFQNVLMFFAFDGLKGFKEAIGAVYPFSKIQRYIIHQIRFSLKYIPHKDKKEFAKDLKTIYDLVNETEGMENLIELCEKWGSKYPNDVKSWKDNWDNLRTLFEFSPSIRKIVYTTNVIESLNSQFRKLTKIKLIFSNDYS